MFPVFSSGLQCWLKLAPGVRKQMHAVSHVNGPAEVTGTTERVAGLQPKSSGFTNRFTWSCTFEKHVSSCKIQILCILQCCVRKTGL